MKKTDKIYVAGHSGMTGSAIVRLLKCKGFTNIVGKTHRELDLTDQAAVEAFFQREKPDYVFLVAAKVGGVGLRAKIPAALIMENELIQCNVIGSAYRYDVKKLIFLGSSCVYPSSCPQPMKEEYLLTGPLEPINEAYALAKISGLKICQYYNIQFDTRYLCVMPCTIYGPGGKFDLENSHALEAMMMKMHSAVLNNKDCVELWGTGKPIREYIYVDDLADACVFLMENYDGNDFFNVGTGKGTSITNLAEMVKEVTGYRGKIVFDTKKPDAAAKQVMDVTRLEGLEWRYKTELEEGLRKTYEYYMKLMMS